MPWVDTTLQASERKRNTKVMYAGVPRTHLLGSSLANLPLDGVRPSHLEGWGVEPRRKSLAESPVRSAYTILRAVLDTAVRDGALASNPAAEIHRLRVTAKEAAHLSPAQVNSLTRPEPTTARSKPFVPLSDPARRLLLDLRSAPSEERRVAASAWQKTGYAFTTEFGEPSEPRNAYRALRVAAAKAGLPDAGLHPLRHSAASVMLVRGVPLKVVSDILRHSSIAITGDIYGHVCPTSPGRPSRCSATLSTSSRGRRRTAEDVASRDRRRGLTSSVRPGHGGPSEAAAAPGEGRLMVFKMVVKPPPERVRGRSGSLRKRPLTCGFALSG